MANGFPEELVHLILTYAYQHNSIMPFLDICYEPFHPPDQLWQCRMPLPYALLVCKTWLRVGTPLYYKTIELANIVQVRKLASTFRSNPQLGLMVRNLRLSGGYGVGLEDVVQYTPNVQSLYVYPVILVIHSNVGLLRALQMLNPRELYVANESSKHHNQKVHDLQEALLKGVQEWTALESVYLPRNYNASSWIKALKNAASLKLLSVHEDELWEFSLRTTKELIAKLRVLECRGESQLVSYIWEKVQSDKLKMIRKKAVFRETDNISAHTKMKIQRRESAAAEAGDA